MSKRITSLQVLRAIAFLGIFTSHCQLNTMFGAGGVATFFVLSGFVMTYAYWKKDTPNSVKGSFRFAIGKVSKIYPLHLIMMLVAIPYQIYMTKDLLSTNTSAWVIQTVAKLGLNLALIQSWVPDLTYSASFNGVSWFLSNCLFLYFMFPFIIKRIKKTRLKDVLIYGIITYVLMIAFCVANHLIGFFDEYWISYTCPLLRIGDFIIGCLLAKVFIETDVSRIKKKTWTMSEIILVIAIVLSAFLYEANCFTSENWIRLTLLWIPSSAALVFLFAQRKGALTEMLEKKPLVTLGNKSQYTFLIHGMIVSYEWILFSYFVNTRLNLRFEGATRFMVNFVLAIICFILTMLAVKFYEKLKNKYSWG